MKEELTTAMHNELLNGISPEGQKHASCISVLQTLEQKSSYFHLHTREQILGWANVTPEDIIEVNKEFNRLDPDWLKDYLYK